MSDIQKTIQGIDPAWAEQLSEPSKLSQHNRRTAFGKASVAAIGIGAGTLLLGACGGDDVDVEEIRVEFETNISALENQITALEAENTELEEQITDLQGEVESLETEIDETEAETTAEETETEEADETTTEESESTDTTEAANEAELELIYGNVVTGVTAAKEVGQFEIKVSDAEQSKENFYNDIRRNPQTLAFYDTCLDQEVPNYDNCAEDSDPEGLKTLTEASERLDEIWAMSLEEKAEVAEDIIEKFEAMDFNGVELHTGHYQTFRLKLDAEGNVVGYEQSTNNRVNDPRIHFSYVDKDGNVQVIVIRSCAQITQDMPKVPTPETSTPDTTVPHETTTTTEPEHTTTTTEPEETTTTTTEPEHTTTTTEPEETTTTTTEPEVEDKYDDGELPETGVDADQDPGTPDVAGEGPAGQTPNDEGYIPSETPPSSQAPDTTQLPAPTTTENPIPATEGTAPESTNPPVVIDESEVVEDNSPTPEAPVNPTEETPENGTLPDPNALGLIGLLGLSAGTGLYARRGNTNIEKGVR